MFRVRALLIAIVSCGVALGASAADRPMTLIRSRNLSVLGQQPARTLRTVARQLRNFAPWSAG